MKQRTRILHFAGILLVIYIALLGFLYFAQDSLIFFPQRITEGQAELLSELLIADTVNFRTPDGVELHGWFIGPESAQPNATLIPRPTVLFFGGNAMTLADAARNLARLRNHEMNVLLVDYRGYGTSGGKPNAETMKSDAEFIFDAAATHPNVDENRISAWGLSIGTGVATHLAAMRPIEKVILFAPFTSTTDLAKKSFFFVPVNLILRHKFDNLSLAPSLTQPALIVHGTRDRELPSVHGRKVAKAWGGEVEYVEVDRGHQDLLDDEGTWQKVIEFLAS